MNQSSGPSNRILADIPCRVCKDNSSGKHYGIYACDGRNRQYICKARGNESCPVDKTHRNQCRACRLGKCVEKGMNRDAVQHERGPRNSTIRRQVAMYMKESTGIGDVIVSPHGFSAPYLSPNPYTVFDHFGPHDGLSVSPPSAAITTLPMSGVDTSIAAAVPTASAPFSTASKPLSSTAIVQQAPKYPHGMFYVQCGSSEAVCEAAAQLLFMSVKWTKTVPAFVALSFEDQLTLLEKNWRELFVLSLIQYPIPIVAGPLLLSAGVNIDVTSACLVFNHSVGETSATSTVELRSLRNQQTVSDLQDQAQLMLSQYISFTYPTQPFRFGKLLLLLPRLAVISSTTIEDLFFRKTIGNIQIERLLEDMYKSSEL